MRDFITEPRLTAGFPLVPMARTKRTSPTSFSIPDVGYHVTWPSNFNPPTQACEEIYMALLALDYLSDPGVVRSRYELLKAAQNVSSSNRVKGGKPSGRHYSELEAALDVLTALRIEHPGSTTPVRILEK